MAAEAREPSGNDFNQEKECIRVNSSRCFTALSDECEGTSIYKWNQAVGAPGQAIELRTDGKAKGESEVKCKNKVFTGVCLMRINSLPVILMQVQQFQIPFWYFIKDTDQISRLLEVLVGHERVPFDQQLHIPRGRDATHAERSRECTRRMSSLTVVAALSSLRAFLESDETTLCFRANGSTMSICYSRNSGSSSSLLRESGCPTDVTPHSGCPTDVTPHSGCPTDVTPHSGCPTDVTPHSDCPTDVTPHSGCPTDVTPHSGCPTDVTPHSGCPTDVTPHSGFPTDVTHNSGCPTDVTPHSGCTIDVPLDAGCPTNLTLDSGAPTELSQSSDNLICPSASDVGTTNSSSLDDALHQDATFLQKKRYSETTQDGDTSLKAHKAPDESSKCKRFNLASCKTSQFSTEKPRLSKKTVSRINHNHITKVSFDAGHHENKKPQAGYDKDGLRDWNRRTLSPASGVKCNTQSATKTYSKRGSWHDFTDHSPNSSDVMSSQKCSALFRTNSRGRWETIRDTHKIDEDSSDNSNNRNNSNESNWGSSDVNSDSDDGRSDNTTNSGEVDDQRSASAGQGDDRPVGASSLGPNRATAESPETPMGNTTDYSAPSTLNNSSSSTPAQLDSSLAANENIVCESLTSSPERKKVPKFIHDQMFETNEDCPLTPRDVALTLEGSPVEQLRRVKLENLHSCEPIDSGHTLLNRRKIRLSNITEIHMHDDEAALNVKSGNEKVAEICCNDGVNVWPCVSSANPPLMEHVCSASKGGLCVATDQLNDGAHDVGRSGVYEGGLLHPGRCADAASGDCTETKSSKCLVKSATDGHVCSAVTNEDAHPGHNNGSPASTIQTGGQIEQELIADLIGSAESRSSSWRSITFLGVLTDRLLEIAGKDTAYSNSENVASVGEKDGNSVTDEFRDKPLATSKSRTVEDSTGRSDLEDNDGSPGQQIELSCPPTFPGSAFQNIDCASSQHRPGMNRKRQSGTRRAAVEPKEKDGVANDDTAAHSSTLDMPLERRTKDNGIACVQNVNSDAPPLNQQGIDTNNFVKHETLAKDSETRLSVDTTSLELKDRQNVPTNVPPAATSVTSANKDTDYKVDIFKTVEYASSLSFGCSAKSSYNGAISCGQTFFDERQSPPFTRSMYDEMCGCNYEQLSAQYEEHHKYDSASKVGDTHEAREMVSKQEGDVDSYSKARLLRASQRRRALMTEIEEITSCADAYNWSRSDNKSCRHEPRSSCPMLDHALSRNLADLESAAQQTDSRLIGTLTIEYLNPPVNGLILLK